MKLDLPEDSRPIQEMFDRFFETESSSKRVRAAEPLGFDEALWRQLIELDVPFMRMSTSSNGGGMSLFDTCLMMEQAGRRLAPVPIAETVVAMRILGEIGGDQARLWMDKLRQDAAVLTLALKPINAGETQLVPAGAIAHGVLTFDGVELAIEIPSTPVETPFMLAAGATGVLEAGRGERHVISCHPEVGRIWSAGIEEWKLLVSSALVGLAKEAISLAASYASERIAFGRPIGANQGIAHPLADDVIDADGAGLFLWWVLKAIADKKSEASASVSFLFWWITRTASRSCAHSLHTFGGYGLTIEYDIQLYHRRAKSWAQMLGDPRDELICGARRLLLGETAALPETGAVEIDFDPPSSGQQMVEETRAIFAKILDPKKHNLVDHNFESHAWDVHRALGDAGLLYPDWPIEYGGRGADADSARASIAVWQEVGYAGLARATTAMIGHIVRLTGQADLKDEVLLRMGRGEITACLGYTEPSGGSDVFAAKTRAIPDGDGWIINGQKMFTSGAELASYVILIARTNPDMPKHQGITLFLVPMDAAGVEIHPVHTFMDERTNATFYQDVRISDRYRLGDVDGGAKVLAAALGLEQEGGHFHLLIDEMVETVADWARTQQRRGRPLIEDSDVLARLGRGYCQARVGEVLSNRPLGAQLAGLPDLAFGPAAKVFSTEAFIAVSADLVDLAAPHSLVRGSSGLGIIEKGYRHSTATSIYGGTSEVLRSMVAERRLGLPRSRA